MNKQLTSRQFCYLAALFLLGRQSVIGESSIGRDIWIVFLIVTAVGVPMLLLYSRIPVRQGVFPVFRAAFGKYIGAAAIVLLCVVALFITVGGTSLFTSFISSTPMEKNVVLPGILFMCVSISLLLWLPFHVIGKSSTVVFPFVAVIMLISVIASTKQMDFGAILPIAEHGVGKIIDGGITAIGFQLAPIFFFLLTFGRYAQCDKKNKPLIIGLFYACGLLLLSHLRNVLVLGYPAVTLYYFPNYISLTQISFGDFFQGMEIIAAQAFLLCQPLKCAACLRFVQDALGSALPKTRKVLPFVLPSLTGILSFIQYTYFPNDVSAKGVMRIALIAAVVGIPMLASVILALRGRLKETCPQG